MLIRGQRQRIGDLLRDPWWFIPRLHITNKVGLRVPFNPNGEQREALLALVERQLVLVLKSRQIGLTTCVIAYLFWRACVGNSSFHVLSVTHEQKACGRVNGMVRDFWRSLPEALRPRIEKDNAQEIVFKSGGHTMAFRQVMAGGRGQGRSWDYRAAHFTEAGFYPRGSAALAPSPDGGGVDEDVWASVLSTLPTPEQDPGLRIIVESTANGPQGLFHRLVVQARENPEWRFLFFPWYRFPAYRRPVPLGFELTDEEEALLEDFPELDVPNLVFRRWKLDAGYSRIRFRKEYPTTWMEPFLLTGASWFDQEQLNRQLGAVPKEWRNKEKGERVYHAFEPTRRYFGAVDTSGGTGGDEAVLIVVRDDLEVCAAFSSTTTGAAALAEGPAARLSSAYGRPPWLVEANNEHGRMFVKRAGELGLRLWKDGRGKDWATTGQTKNMVYDWGRHLVDQGFVKLNDERLIQQCMGVREQEDGSIRCDDGRDNYDDHPMALVLALWNARRQYTQQHGTERPLTMAQRKARHNELQGRR